MSVITYGPSTAPGEAEPAVTPTVDDGAPTASSGAGRAGATAGSCAE